MPRALIGLGANLGDRAATLKRALERLHAPPALSLVRASVLRDTAPVGGPADQPRYLNAAALVETSLPPLELWRRLADIERDFGRERLVDWGPRTLDLDLLLYNQQTLDSPELTIPHPRLALRRFVLDPAAEIAPAWVHPLIGWTLERLARHLVESPPIARVIAAPSDLRLAERFVAELSRQVGAHGWRIAVGEAAATLDGPLERLRIFLGIEASDPSRGPWLSAGIEPSDASCSALVERVAAVLRGME